MRDLTSGPQGALAKAHVSARPWALGVLGVVSTVFASACGPIGYVQQVRGRALDAVLEARRAGAEQAAPYEFTAAVEYLNKAEEEGGESEYQDAIEYGRRSEDLAKRALVATRRGSGAAAGAQRGHP